MSGGVETYLDRLIDEQSRQGIDVSLLAGSHELRPTTTIERHESGDTIVHRLYRDDLYFDHYAKAYHAGAEGEIEALLRRERPDVVHLHQWIRLTNNIVEIAARLNIPTVVTTHDVYTSCPRCFRVRRDDEACYRPLSIESCLDCVPKFGHESDQELRLSIELFHDQYRRELAMAARVLVADPATSNLICDTTTTPIDRFEVLPLPYQHRFDGAPTANSPADDEPLRFAYWGVLTYRKGAQVMAQAFADLHRAGSPRKTELHLFGGIDTPELEAELRAITDGTPVVFHGRYEYEQLAAANLHMAIFPMLCFETWGFVLDECFELGLPCITTENGALARRAGAAAIRVPPRDVTAMRAAMARVLRDPGMLGKLRAGVPALPPSNHEHALKLASIYREAIEAGATKTPPLPAWRRARLTELQRESAMARLLPPGGPQ